MPLKRTITPLIWRVIVFLSLFILVSGLAGQRIIGGGIVEAYGFGLYGGMGKALIFGIIAAALLIRHNKAKPDLRPWRPALLGWTVLLVAAFGGGWMSIGALLDGRHEPLYVVGAHGGLLLSVVASALLSFGPANIRTLGGVYRRQIIQAGGLMIAFYIFLLGVYALWQPLSGMVLYSVYWLLGLSGLTVAVVPPYTLLLDKFGITVAQYCSGVESIALFTSLYVLVGLLDNRQLNRKRYIIIFPFALVGLMACNIVRVYGLTMAGYHINTELAFSLFHTYAGVLFFIVYSALFWSFAYKYVLNSAPVAKAYGRQAI